MTPAGIRACVRVCLCAVLLACGGSDVPPADAPDETPDDTGTISIGTNTELELRAALHDLVAGPGSGATRQTWFSEATADAVRSVSVDADGDAIVDFSDLRPLIPNASSSAGSAMLLHELDSAVFSVPAVQSVEYRMLGSCATFWEWLQYGCRIVRREER